MVLADESVDLAFDTEYLRRYGEQYGKAAQDLRRLASELDNCLTQLKEDGWTTNAGIAFSNMVNTNWENNIEKYAALLDTLNSIISSAASDYEALVDEIEHTKINI